MSYFLSMEFDMIILSHFRHGLSLQVKYIFFLFLIFRVVYDPDQVQRWETARRWAVFRILVVVLTPLLLLPIPLVIQGQVGEFIDTMQAYV